MAAALVLVNGLPGSGKTTLALALAGELSCPLLSKDALKEAMASTLGATAPASLGAVAMETVWLLARDMPGLVIIDSFWWKRRDLARERYASRTRDVIHDDEQRLANDWEAWAQDAGPLAITPVVCVDTTQSASVADAAQRVRLKFNMRSAFGTPKSNEAS